LTSDLSGEYGIDQEKKGGRSSSLGLSPDEACATTMVRHIMAAGMAIAPTALMRD
jgi:hypothetical protein